MSASFDSIILTVLKPTLYQVLKTGNADEKLQHLVNRFKASQGDRNEYLLGILIRNAQSRISRTQLDAALTCELTFSAASLPMWDDPIDASCCANSRPRTWRTPTRHHRPCSPAVAWVPTSWRPSSPYSARSMRRHSSWTARYASPRSAAAPYAIL